MKARIAVLPGDGIGPEVTAAARRVLAAVAAAFGHEFDCEEAPIGGIAIDTAGRPLPRETLELCRVSDATLLGAVGGPQWESSPARVRPEAGLLELRRALGLYANIRPVWCHPRLAGASPLREDVLHGVDLVVVRELTGGIYFGAKSRETVDGQLTARDVCSYSVAEIERVARVACAIANGRRGQVVSVDKANVLETSRLWRDVVSRVVAEEFPAIRLEHMLVDACAMQLIREPSRFDVVLTENMFGDILTDEAAVLAGSIGLLPSASLGDHSAATPGARRRGLYEPIHGSAPALAGHDVANPIGAILSAAMLLRWSLHLSGEAEAIESAVSSAIEDGWRTADVACGARAATTTAVTSAIVDRIGPGAPAVARSG